MVVVTGRFVAKVRSSLLLPGETLLLLPKGGELKTSAAATSKSSIAARIVALEINSRMIVDVFVSFLSVLRSASITK